MIRPDAPPVARIDWSAGVPRSAAHGDRYYSDDALAEIDHVFIEGNDLPARWQRARRFTIGELGFGTGLNCVATIHRWQQQAPADAVLDYVAIESHPLAADDMTRALRAAAPHLAGTADALVHACADLHAGHNLRVLAGGRVRLLLLIGDVQAMAEDMRLRADAWYLDGFAPACNPDMWSASLMQALAQRSAADATCATFSAAGWVRRNLQTAGWQVHKRPGFGHKREMLSARLPHPPSHQPQPPGVAWPAYDQLARAHVVGGGLAGAATARALAERGVGVTVFDAQGPAPSRLPALLVRDYGERGDSLRKAFYRAACAHALHRLDGMDGMAGWHASGLALLDHRGTLQPDRQTAAETNRRLGVTTDTPAAWVDRGGWMTPGPVCAALLDHPNIQRLDQRYDADAMSADHPTVLAPGAGGVAFAALRQFPARRARGQMSGVVGTQPPSAPLAGGGLAVFDGQALWLGSSFKRGDADPTPRADEAEAYLPGWQTELGAMDATQTTHRAGVRVTTGDRMPLLGPLPDMDDWRARYVDLHHGKPHDAMGAPRWQHNLWVNWGHGARGATAALLSGELIAAAMTGAPLPIDQALWQAVHPGRFILRALRRSPGRPGGHNH